MKEFTPEELAEYDGTKGKPSYVAYKGVVYDVSESAMWLDGDHEAMHRAGEDLTDAHQEAPHDEYVVDFPVVGTLLES